MKCCACQERPATVSIGPTWVLCDECLAESNAYDDAHGLDRAVVLPLTDADAR
jgi:hypothetical protein